MTTILTRTAGPDRLRIGAVNYLNSKPLIEGLPAFLSDHAELRLDYPSRLADELSAGRLDVALIPSIEYFRGVHYEVISDACVAAHGPVLSVKLYSRVPWGNVRSLALDEGSRTSATLARVLLAERHGVFPRLQPLPLNQRTQDSNADAILLIGDRAISAPDEKFLKTWDLGEEWFQWTGLPFVFAMWVATTASSESASDRLSAVEDALSQARDLGIEHLNDIARREAPLLGLSLPTTISYLSENLQYHLGSAERSGLKLFYELASGMGLAPEGVELRFRACESLPSNR
jgi:chorismate dehydratase